MAIDKALSIPEMGYLGCALHAHHENLNRLERQLTKEERLLYKHENLSLNLQHKGEKLGMGWAWWHTPSISALRRQRQEKLCELSTSLVYTDNARPARGT